MKRPLRKVFGLSLLAGLCGWGMPGLAQDPSLPLPPPSAEQPLIIAPSVQDRVNEELVVICGEHRCVDYRREVRVPILTGDTIEDVQQRLSQAVLDEIDRSFQSQPFIERVVVDGYVYRGTSTFATLEVPLLTVFVPRHRWLVGRYGIENDGILYSVIQPQVEALLTPPLGDENGGAETPDEEGDDLSLPPLPAEEDEEEATANGDEPEDSDIPEGTIQRAPIDL
jgi:hypothetical protein